MTVLLDTTDLGEAEEVLSANYSQLRFRVASDQPTHTWATRSMLGPMAIDELRYTYSFDYRGDPMDGIVLVRARSGSVIHQQADGDVDVGRSGSVTAIAWRSGVPYSGQLHDGHYDAMLIDRSLLTSVATTGFTSSATEAVTLTSGTPISPTAGRHLANAIDYVIRDVVPNPDATASLLVASGVARLLAATMLATFPSTAVLEPTIEDRHDSTPVLLRRAIAFIEDNAYRDISLTDIARAIYVTPRALQYMFRKHRDCTPMEYLRRVRLHHAHLDLVAANRMTATVGQVAARWGFGHLGRFAVYYREQYGQSPHSTLRD